MLYLCIWDWYIKARALSKNFWAASSRPEHYSVLNVHRHYKMIGPYSCMQVRRSTICRQRWLITQPTCNKASQRIWWALILSMHSRCNNAPDYTKAMA
jgi:hypothetical protein